MNAIILKIPINKMKLNEKMNFIRIKLKSEPLKIHIDSKLYGIYKLN